MSLLTLGASYSLQHCRANQWFLDELSALRPLWLWVCSFPASYWENLTQSSRLSCYLLSKCLWSSRYVGLLLFLHPLLLLFPMGHVLAFPLWVSQVQGLYFHFLLFLRLAQHLTNCLVEQFSQNYIFSVKGAKVHVFMWSIPLPSILSLGNYDSETPHTSWHPSAYLGSSFSESCLAFFKKCWVAKIQDQKLQKTF